MRFSIGLPTHHVDEVDEWCSARAIAEMSAAAEAAGADAVFVTDHPAPDTTFMAKGGHHALDPFVTLTVAATATSRLRLHTNLVIMAYRNPFITAKALATLDVVSNGRTIIGTGAGYLGAEFAAVGADFDRRNAVTDESILAIRALWSGEPVTMEGLHFSAVDTVARPLPVQSPHPPIWIGGNSDRAIRRTVELADGWNPMPSPARASRLLRTPPIESIEDLDRRIGDLRAACEKAGRAEVPEVIFTPIGVDMFRGELPSAQAFIDDMGALAAIGVSTVTVNLPAITRAQWIDTMAWLGAEVIAKVS
ncbi:MAG: TIGR03619 family F420-dependent LLM class oxidoreductase [Acidobacteria bacterium]|nr:TIGR03619 family F420-dependent LLM class oxidoreductase [Acidobacteriota bacterium]